MLREFVQDSWVLVSSRAWAPNICVWRSWLLVQKSFSLILKIPVSLDNRPYTWRRIPVRIYAGIIRRYQEVDVFRKWKDWFQYEWAPVWLRENERIKKTSSVENRLKWQDFLMSWSSVTTHVVMWITTCSDVIRSDLPRSACFVQMKYRGRWISDVLR